MFKNKIIFCFVLPQLSSMERSADRSLGGWRRVFTCAECGRQYLTRSGLQQHVEFRHLHLTPFPCIFCGKEFSTSSKVKLHVKTHTEGKAYLCGECPMRFLRHDQLQAHKRRVHLNLKLHKCAVCGRGFNDKRRSMDHQKLHDRPPQKCSFCHETFLTLREKQQHQNRSHPQRRCAVCDITLESRAQLTNHLRTKKHEENLKKH